MLTLLYYLTLVAIVSFSRKSLQCQLNNIEEKLIRIEVKLQGISK